MSDKQFSGRVALVTGSTRGIGWSIAERLGKAGARVALNGRSPRSAERVQKALEALRKLEIKADYYACDITASGSVRNMIEAVVKDFGKVDILVNNAGISGIPKPIIETSEEEWDTVIKTDLYGTFLMMKHVIPQMIKQNYGRIVNISSIAGKEGNPNMTPYCSAKHGVVGLTKSASREVLDYNIRINAVCPALIKTEILDDWPQSQIDLLTSKIPLGRLGTVDEVADLVLFLAGSEAVNFITGQALDLSGGRADF